MKLAGKTADGIEDKIAGFLAVWMVASPLYLAAVGAAEVMGYQAAAGIIGAAIGGIALIGTGFAVLFFAASRFYPQFFQIPAKKKPSRLGKLFYKGIGRIALKFWPTLC